jgi:hypothetical protein
VDENRFSGISVGFVRAHLAIPGRRYDAAVDVGGPTYWAQ